MSLAIFVFTYILLLSAILLNHTAGFLEKVVSLSSYVFKTYIHKFFKREITQNSSMIKCVKKKDNVADANLSRFYSPHHPVGTEV